MSVVFPKLLKGGNHLIAPGIVVPPGMRIRNPALLKPTLFARQLKEILQVWSTTPGGAARDTLGERVAVMWLQYQYFRRVAAFAYGRNKRRTARQTKSFTRFSCCAPNGALVSLKLSPLATLKDVKRAVAAKSAARCPRAARDPRYVVLLDGARVAVWKLSISIKSKSIRLIFRRVDRSRRVLEAQRKSLVQIVRLRAH